MTALGPKAVSQIKKDLLCTLTFSIYAAVIVPATVNVIVRELIVKWAALVLGLLMLFTGVILLTLKEIVGLLPLITSGYLNDHFFTGNESITKTISELRAGKDE